ncbi:hypothetical protein EMCRGX_G033313 [Ephydatia muelleri]
MLLDHLGRCLCCYTNLMGGQMSVPLTDLSGRVAIVTGGNTGIGYETAKALAKMGAHTIIACRTESKATEAIQRMRTEVEVESPGKQLNVEYMSLDLASLQATREFAAAFKERHLPLHILVNNAGIAFVPFAKTADGYEMQYQVNYLGHFLLTLELLPVIMETARSHGDVRIVNVSSAAHKWGTLNPSNMNGEASYSRWSFYGNSKLYIIMSSYALQRRLIGAGVTVSSVHPGSVGTEVGRGISDSKLLSWTWFALSHFNKSPERGAFSSINCAANPSLNSRQAFYYDSGGNQVEPSNMARDESLQEQLWEISVNILRTYLSPEVLERYEEANRGSTQSATVEGRHNGSEVEQARAAEQTEQTVTN